MIEPFVYAAFAVLFVVGCMLEYLQWRGTIRAAVAEWGAWGAAMALLMGIAVVLGWPDIPDTLVAGGVAVAGGVLAILAYAGAVYLLSGRSVREMWAARDAQAAIRRSERDAEDTHGHRG